MGIQLSSIIKLYLIICIDSNSSSHSSSNCFTFYRNTLPIWINNTCERCLRRHVLMLRYTASESERRSSSLISSGWFGWSELHLLGLDGSPLESFIPVTGWYSYRNKHHKLQQQTNIGWRLMTLTHRMVSQRFKWPHSWIQTYIAIDSISNPPKSRFGP